MSRKAILQLVLPLIGLSVLFCLLAFAPGEKHSQPPLLEMSVILRDGDGGVSTMRKGMEQAAEDLNVELRFLTPAEDNNAAEQVLLLERDCVENTLYDAADHLLRDRRRRDDMVRALTAMAVPDAGEKIYWTLRALMK